MPLLSPRWLEGDIYTFFNVTRKQTNHSEVSLISLAEQNAHQTSSAHFLLRLLIHHVFIV